MRILIVTATKPGSSRAPAETFARHVKEALKKALRAHEKVDVCPCSLRRILRNSLAGLPRLLAHMSSDL